MCIWLALLYQVHLIARVKVAPSLSSFLYYILCFGWTGWKFIASSLLKRGRRNILFFERLHSHPAIFGIYIHIFILVHILCSLSIITNNPLSLLLYIMLLNANNFWCLNRLPAQDWLFTLSSTCCIKYLMYTPLSITYHMLHPFLQLLGLWICFLFVGPCTCIDLIAAYSWNVMGLCCLEDTKFCGRVITDLLQVTNLPLEHYSTGSFIQFIHHHLVVWYIHHLA